MSIPQRILGRSGLSVSTIGLGGAAVGEHARRDDHIRLIHHALDAGINLIDTAACYAGSEECIGQALRDRRDQAVLVSKCGHHECLPDGSLRSLPISLVDVDRALQRLATDRIDVMLLHSYDFDLLARGDAIACLIKAREQGKIRAIGYSGDNAPAGWAAGHPQIAVIECSLNLADQANGFAVLPPALRFNTGVVAKRPLANAAWRFANTPPEQRPAHLADYAERLARIGLDPVQLGIAPTPNDRAWAALALRFTLSLPGVAAALIGTANLDHLEDHIRTAALPPLPEPVRLACLQAFDRAARACPQPWPGLN